MLKGLSIRNVALIERAELEFSAGLNVLSGETGAGKSVILDCIDFVLGAKADKRMIRYGAEECLVCAEFTAESKAVQEVLSELDIPADDTLVVTRKLTADGRGSLRLNGCPVTVSSLRRVTSLLVDVHGQSEHFFLLKESNQLRLLDSIAGEKVALCKEEVRTLLARRKEILSELSLLGGDEGERERKLDILRYQIDELTRADLKAGEEETLLSLREKFRNAERIIDGLSAAHGAIAGDGGSSDGVNSALRSLRAISRYGEEYDDISERLENVSAELEDLGETIDSLLSDLSTDEREREKVETRLDEIRTLKKKYGGSVESAIEFLQKAQEECELLENSAERCEMLKDELTKVEDRLFAACVRLTDERKKAAEGFSRRVQGELTTLGIGAAKFEIDFGGYSREDIPSATSEGLGTVAFLFSANAGEPLKELGKIISGGEMSRFMLAVKAQLSSLGEIGTYLFDEIDAGIGGATARVVAEKFACIAKNVQIIAVSHLAQIASFADRQFFIQKQEEAGRTFTRIFPLKEEERIGELARLIGDSSSEHAKKHAEELLASANVYKNSHTGG